MNSWYFTFEYPPDFGGGLSTYMRFVTDHHAKSQDDTLVVFTLSHAQSGATSTRFIHDNVVLVTVNPLRSSDDEKLGYWVAVSRAFERAADLLMTQIAMGSIDLPTPDYIEFADGFGIGMMSIQQKLCCNSRFTDVPILVNAHTPTYVIDRLNQEPVYKLPNYWTSQMELQALAGADLVIGPSQAILDVVADELALKGSSMRNTAVLHNPFEAPEAPTQDHEAPRDHFYMASRLTHWKGVETAIKAMEILWADGQEIPFHIYGEDTVFNVTNTDYSAYITKRFGKYVDSGLIKLMGKVPRDDIRKAAQTAYAQIHPSHFDNFPYSIVEAMSEGTVCVAGTNGGIKEISTHGQDIFLADVQDATGFAEALKAAIALTPKERAAISKRAQETIRTSCDPASYFERKEALVRDLAPSPDTGATFPFLAPPKPNCVFPASVAAENTPELSIVVPYFNMGAFIDETLDSIKKSTFKNLEIILVNDGSTDPVSQKRLTELHEAHGLDENTLRIIDIPNGGVANARNTGAKHSRAPFIALLDADDLIAARYYEKAIRVLKKYDNVSFVGSWIEDYNEEGRIRNWATWNAEPPLQLIMNQTNCQSLVYKREAFMSDGMHDPDLRMFLDDWEGVIALMAGGHRGVMIPEAMFQYRIRAGSIFRSNGNLWDLNYEKIAQKHRTLYNEWGADIATFMNVNGPNNFYHIAGKPSTLRK